MSENSDQSFNMVVYEEIFFFCENFFLGFWSVQK